MNLRKFITVIFIILTSLLYSCRTQTTNIIILGDLHYDLPGDHDMDWLSKRPDDYRQVTEEYTISTSRYWDSLMDVIRNKSKSLDANASIIIQLGDLSEGLAGTPEKAKQMAKHTIEAVEKAQIPVPWILVKGNHDITGPGAKEAYSEYYLPMIRRETRNKTIQNANYSYSINNVQIICLDPWDSSVDIVGFLDKELSGSDAVVKIVAIHEPVIPVTERCWHILKNDSVKREKLLNVIAKNKAIVVCAHLHRYSVVKRNTDFGPIIQIMTVSIVKDSSYINPDKLITEYGSSLVDGVPSWDPATADRRKKLLSGENRYVTYYKQNDLPGYSLLKIDRTGKNILLEYYAAFGKKPFDIVNISELMN